MNKIKAISLFNQMCINNEKHFLDLTVLLLHNDENYQIHIGNFKNYKLNDTIVINNIKWTIIRSLTFK